MQGSLAVANASWQQKRIFIDFLGFFASLKYFGYREHGTDPSVGANDEEHGEPERAPHPDREKSRPRTQPIKREAASKAARLATVSGKDCDIQVSPLQSRGVCQRKTISKRDFSIVLTDEGEKSNRCEGCVYPAAVCLRYYVY